MAFGPYPVGHVSIGADTIIWPVGRYAGFNRSTQHAAVRRHLNGPAYLLSHQFSRSHARLSHGLWVRPITYFRAPSTSSRL
ncbi:MAG: hypothetical protein EBZ89_05845 [Chloroflexi bacterium]|nr:hypothetical protein [Chloroflexota bacterium]